MYACVDAIGIGGHLPQRQNRTHSDARAAGLPRLFRGALDGAAAFAESHGTPHDMAAGLVIAIDLTVWRRVSTWQWTLLAWVLRARIFAVWLAVAAACAAAVFRAVALAVALAVAFAVAFACADAVALA